MKSLSVESTNVFAITESKPALLSGSHLPAQALMAYVHFAEMTPYCDEQLSDIVDLALELYEVLHEDYKIYHGSVWPSVKRINFYYLHLEQRIASYAFQMEPDDMEPQNQTHWEAAVNELLGVRNQIVQMNQFDRHPPLNRR